MSSNLDLNINVNTTGAEGSVGSLKKMLREAQAEVAILSQKFGATSTEAANAAKKAAELKDRISDARALTDAFNPDAKFKSLTASLSGVAGGFGAVQGAMALFGAESDNVQKTLLKVQSAMALSQGLQAVGDSIDSFKNLGLVIRTQVVSAFTTLRGAIIATGVGALAVGVGLLIANFEQVKETIVKMFPSLEGFGERFMNIVHTITDFIGVTSQAKRDAEKLSDAIATITASYDMSIKELEAQGGREDEVYALKKQRIEAQLSALTDANDKEYKQRAQLNSDLRVLAIEEENRKRDLLIERLEWQTKYEYDEEIKKYERLHEIRTKIGNQEALDWRKIAEFKKQDKEDFEKEADDRATNALQLGLQARSDVTMAFLDRDTATRKKNQEDLVNAQETFENAKFQIAAQGLNLIAELAGQGTVIAKAAALSQIIIDTGRGFASGLTIAQEGAKATGPAAPFAFPIFYATQIAAVLGAVGKAKSILSQVAGGGSVGSVSAPTIGTAAPITPQVPQPTTTNISQDSINDLGNQAIKAYVVESDITKSQNRVSTIQNQASFG